MRTFPGVAPSESSAPTEGAASSSAATAPPSDQRSSPVVEVERGEHDVEAALAASTRAEATLSALYHAIQQVTAGVSGAREANDQLAAELQRVREMLGASNEQRLVLKNQVAQLEREVQAAAQEREFLVAEQDRFLTGLLEEHENTVERLVAEREEAFARLEKAMRQVQESPQSARRTAAGLGPNDPTPLAPSVRPVDPTAPSDIDVHKLLLERERAREVLRRLQQQRDEAQQSLVEMRSERDKLASELGKLAPGRFTQAEPRPWSPQDGRRTQPAIPMAVNRETDPSPPGDDDLGQALQDRLTAPGPSPQELVVASRPTPPPGTPAQAAPTAPPNPGAKPPLKRKPDPTLSPLGGYSVSGDEVQSDVADGPGQTRPRRG